MCIKQVVRQLGNDELKAEIKAAHERIEVQKDSLRQLVIQLARELPPHKVSAILNKTYTP